MKTPFPTLTRSLLLVVASLALITPQAQAHGGGGWRGGHHHRGGGAYWVAPALVGGVMLGAALARPAYAYPVTPAPVYAAPPAFVPNAVTTASPLYPPQPVGYFCPTSGQFYPYVATCSVPWQLL